jgi:hypothetical protein
MLCTVQPSATIPADRAQRLLERAAPLLRLPTSPGRLPEVLPDGSGPSAALKTGLCCPITGRFFPYRNGVLDLLGDDLEKTLTQHTLDTPLTAWFPTSNGRYRHELATPSSIWPAGRATLPSSGPSGWDRRDW